MFAQYRAWSGAVTVLAITSVLVVLDLGDRSVHRYWSRHTFTSSVLSGLLVLLLTVLVADRVVRRRQLKNQSRAIAAQASVIVAQAARAADAITRASRSTDDRDDASGELRTFAQMLLTSAPVLIEATVSREFLETAQRVAAQLFQVLRGATDEGAEESDTRPSDAVEQLRAAAAPLLQILGPDQPAAVS